MDRYFPVCAIAILCSTVPSANGAAIQLVDVFKNISYAQTSAAAPTSPTGYFADIELSSQNAGDFHNVSVTYPGPGSPTSLPQVSSTFFSIGPGFATRAAMNAAVPFGSYQYAATNIGVNQTATLSYTADAFAAAIPALAASSYNALQGLNPATALTVDFNSFTPNATASEGLTFFTIFGTTFENALSSSSTRVVLPADLLAPNTTYTLELDFSDRINGTDPNGIPTLVGSDVRTDVTFTTGPAAVSTPEPGAFLLVSLGLLALAVSRTGYKPQ